MMELRDGVDPRHEATFTLGNRFRRAAWGVVYTLLFRPSPRPFHGWRSGLLSLFGAKMGKGCHVYSKVQIWAPWNLEIHNQAGIGDGVILYSMGLITIGERAVLSQGAHLCAGTHEYEDPSFRLIAKPISIGKEAWICAEAFVGPGIVVGDGAVIGARSVVTRDMPQWTVCAGNPCRPLKKRVMRS
ncbi:MAG: colanic acid biosynthesis acetyltransferase WcaF [Chlorobia bacterium]|nr:colanic acid biosynthesis acetyltransferase WcaF [Fimbriimonadaceae bacterium]